MYWDGSDEDSNRINAVHLDGSDEDSYRINIALAEDIFHHFHNKSALSVATFSATIEMSNT